MSGAGTARERLDAALASIREARPGPLRFMEVCGTHTMAIGRHGLRSLLPPDLHLLSGPGCPVCVTPGAEIDQAIGLAFEPGVELATFGDMIRVPGDERGTLDAARAAGASVRVVYSALDALARARATPGRQVVFVGVGFETTSPGIANAMRDAHRDGVDNFSVLTSFKVVPPALTALAAAPDLRLDGFLCPGHVSAVIGTEPYEAVARERRVPCVVAGFEAVDILEGVAALVAQCRSGRSEVENRYGRVVRREGNPAAQAMLSEVLEPCDAVWRGIGPIPGTGLRAREAYAGQDARRRFGLPEPQAFTLPAGCSCGEVMRGLRTPPECPLFGRSCTPSSPVGPCMVSSEGACAAYHRYGG